jgi:hypothetical protein
VTAAGDVDGALEAFQAGQVATLTPAEACGGGRGTHCH